MSHMTDRQSGKTLAQLREVAAYLEARPAERATYVTPNHSFAGYARDLMAANGLPAEVVARIDFMPPLRFAQTARCRVRLTVCDHAATINLRPSERDAFRVAWVLTQERWVNSGGARR
jgi:hypothetical protein